MSIRENRGRVGAWPKCFGVAAAIASATFLAGFGHPIEAQARPASVAGGTNGIFQSPTLNHAVPQNFDGTSINWVTGAFDDTGPVGSTWDMNFFDNGANPPTASSFALFPISANGNAFVVDGGTISLLQSGATIGPASTFGTGTTDGSAAWQAGADGYIGFKFNCNGRLANPVSGVCYGYVHVTTTGTQGFPATIVDYAYDGDGNPISIGPVQTFTVTPSVGTPSGTITPATPQTVNSGSTTSFALAADAGFHVDTVTGTCGGTLAGATYTTNAITADCTVIANFAAGEAQPVVSVAPSSLSVSLDAGATQTSTLTVKNTGGGTLTYSIAEAPAARPSAGVLARHARLAKSAGARSHFPRDERHAVPIGNVNAPAVKHAPLRANAGGPRPLAPFGTTVNGFAQNADDKVLVSLDFSAPGTLTTVGSPNGETLWGAGFLNGDTTTLYMLGDTGFYSVDTATGVATTISASAGGGDVWAMTADPSTQTLYWIGPSAAQELSTVDPTTGATTLVAAISGASAADIISSIAADAQGHLFGVDKTTDSLVAIDKATGATAVIGSLGIDTEFVSGLAFDMASGTLYFADGPTGLYTVDPATGTATPIGAVQDGHQLVALAVSGGGPAPDACTNPADVPWLSVAPASGSLAAGVSADSTVTVDATALAAGSYSANLCVTSNDTTTPLVTVPVSVTVAAVHVDPCSAKDTIFCDGFDGSTTPPGDVVTGTINQPVVDDAGNGSSFDFATASYHPYDSSISTDDINLYDLANGGTTDPRPGIFVYWYGDAAPSGISVGGVVDSGGTEFAVLHSGDVIGPASTISGASLNLINWVTGTDGYIGIAFYNETTSSLNYGYIHMTTTAPLGFPAQVLDWGYDSSGAAITIP